MKINYQHKELANGRWRKLSLVEQLANVGSEVYRTISWKNQYNQEYSDKAFDRALELLDFTIADPKNIGRLKELTRLRECLVDYFMFNNIYGSSDEKWEKYFYAFAYAARNPLYKNEQ
jgi:hypothetical protein